MKTLHLLLLSLLALQALLLASSPTQARPLGYSAGSSVIKVMILRPRPGRHSPPPPTPGYSPEPGPGRNNKSPPTPFNSLLHMESLNPSAASA